MNVNSINVTELRRRAEVLNGIDSIYYVYPLSFKKVDLEKELDDNIKDFEKMHGCKVVDKDKYVKYLHVYGKDKVSISGFISSFHIKEAEAMQFAIENGGDINEAGSYNYCAIVKAPVRCIYYNTSQNPDNDITILKYNPDINKYQTLNKKAEEYEVILHHVWGMYFDTKKLPW